MIESFSFHKKKKPNFFSFPLRKYFLKNGKDNTQWSKKRPHKRSIARGSYSDSRGRFKQTNGNGSSRSLQRKGGSMFQKK